VVVQGDALWVSVFRAASLLRVGADGQVGAPIRPSVAETTLEPDVAWRVVARPNDGGLFLLHQIATRAEVVPAPGGYSGEGGDGGVIVEGAVTMVDPDGTMSSPQSTAGLVLALDFAVAPDGSRAIAVAPGNWMLDNLQVAEYRAVQWGAGATPLRPSSGLPQPRGQAIAVAFDGAGHVVVQTREPSELFLQDLNQSIPLGGATRADTGHTIFHSDPGGGLACASCHPEGRDDGHVWNFAMVGPRRTQYLRGGLLATAPFHWDGEFSDVGALMQDVFSGRMSGGVLAPDQTNAVAQWLDALPRLTVSPPADPAAVARGDALFHDATVGCAGCHAGTLLTNNANADVGTGGAFQVPALRNLALRAPYMHTGCAGTLRDRFTPACGGAAHGNTAALSDAQRDDLIAYLQTL
jgi:mono/diheme cytochrome c family protein